MALSVDANSLKANAVQYDRVAEAVLTDSKADPSLTQAVETGHGPVGAPLTAAFREFQAALQRAGEQVAQLHGGHADRLRTAADLYTNTDGQGADRISAAGQVSESGQSHEVQMVSSASDESGAGSSGTGPGVPPVIVGRPRPVWPNGVPRV
ncbi:type VII secretion target [Mycolicibacterium boenickei]